MPATLVQAPLRPVNAAPARAPIAPEKATAPDRPDPLPEGPVVILGIYPAVADDDAPRSVAQRPTHVPVSRRPQPGLSLQSVRVAVPSPNPAGGPVPQTSCRADEGAVYRPGGLGSMGAAAPFGSGSALGVGPGQGYQVA